MNDDDFMASIESMVEEEAFAEPGKRVVLSEGTYVLEVPAGCRAIFCLEELKE